MLREPQHERKIVNDIKTPPFVLSPSLGGMLGSVFGGQAARAGSATPRAPAEGLASMLDLNGDGNPLDDILRMAAKAVR